jgi:hypothetical protein
VTNFSGSFRYWEGIQNDPAIAGAWGTPNSFNMTLVEQVQGGTGGVVSINIGGLTTFTLSTAQGATDQSRPFLQSFTGALPADCTVTIPNVARTMGFAQNLTSGFHQVILSAGAGTTLAIPADGAWYWYSCDGATNVSAPFIGLSSGLNSNAQITLLGGASLQGTDNASNPKPLIFCGQGSNPAFTKVVSAGAGVSIAPAANPNGTLWTVTDTGIINQVGSNYTITTDPTGVNNPYTISQTNSSPARSMVAINVIATSSNYEVFTFSGVTRGSIQPITGGTTVAYNTTSDATMKIDRGEITGYEATHLLMKLAPRWFNWKEDPDAPGVPGFFAQQVHRWWPWAVTSGRGRIGSKKRVPWQMDNSKLVPLLTAALQEALRRIEALERLR